MQFRLMMRAPAKYHQVLWVFDGQRAEHNCVDGAEDRSIGADAERQSQNCNRGKPRRLGEHAQRVAQVLHCLFDPEQRALVAMRLLCLLHAAVSAPRSQPSFFGGHAAALEVVGEQSEVRGDFAGEIRFHALVAEEATQPGNDSPQTRHGYCSSPRSFSTTPAIWRQRTVSSPRAFNPALVMV